MTFRVEITRTAAREIEERYQRITEQGRNSAEKWRAGLIEAVEALGTNPEMYPEAPEAEWYGAGLREFCYGKRCFHSEGVAQLSLGHRPRNRTPISHPV
jgi:plasmid stabilization system protein ParE